MFCFYTRIKLAFSAILCQDLLTVKINIRLMNNNFSCLNPFRILNPKKIYSRCSVLKFTKI